MLDWALAEGPALTPHSCPTAQIVAAFKSGDETLSDLLAAIAASEAFTHRTRGR
jgi:hypothetical protein